MTSAEKKQKSDRWLWCEANRGVMPPWIKEAMEENRKVPELPLPRMKFPEYWMYYPKRPKVSDMEYFWLKCQGGSADECWLWNGCKSFTTGVPLHCIKEKEVNARRLSWLYHRGMRPEHWPAGKRCVLLCNTPLCVNPAHLAIGTTRGRGKPRISSDRWQKIIDPLNDTLTFQSLWDEAEAAMETPEKLKEYVAAHGHLLKA